MKITPNNVERVELLTMPLNGECGDLTNANVDELFAIMMGYHFRTVRRFDGPALVSMTMGLRHRGNRARPSGLTNKVIPRSGIDFENFGPRYGNDPRSVGNDDSFFLIAMERVARAYMSHELHRHSPKSAEDFSREGPDEILLDLYAYTRIDTRKSVPEYPHAVANEIWKRIDEQRIREGLEPIRGSAPLKLEANSNQHHPALESSQARQFVGPGMRALTAPPQAATSSNANFSTALNRQDRYDEDIENSEIEFMSLLAKGMSVTKKFTVATKLGNGEPGPYVQYRQDSNGNMTVFLVSNFDVWEPKEMWFQAVLSNLEWLGIFVDVPGRVVYRKTWKPRTPTWHIANAVALVISQVFDAWREGLPDFLYDAQQEGTLREFASEHVLAVAPEFFGEDQSIAAEFVESSVMMAPEPVASEVSPAYESQFALDQIRIALKIASDHDDENGMYTLGELEKRFEERLRHEQWWLNEMSDRQLGRTSTLQMIQESFLPGSVGRHITDITMISERDLLSMAGRGDVAAIEELVRRNPELGFE